MGHIGGSVKKYFGFLLFLSVSQLVTASPDGGCLSNLGLGVIPNGATASGYPTSISLPGTPCAMTTVTCIDGTLTGPDLYPSCSDIMQDCQGIPNGGFASGYISPVPPCIQTTITCTNGTLSGPMPSPSCNE
jgi:hypothetical protein